MTGREGCHGSRKPQFEDVLENLEVLNDYADFAFVVIFQ
jgi:hypothetical protein